MKGEFTMPRHALAPPDPDRQQVLSKAVINAASYLDLPMGKLSRILGVSPATISRLYTAHYWLTPEKKEWDFAVLLIRLFRSLDAIVGGATEDARARTWMMCLVLLSSK